MNVVLKFLGGSISLTGFTDERVAFCDIDANGRMGRDGAKWGL